MVGIEDSIMQLKMKIAWLSQKNKQLQEREIACDEQIMKLLKKEQSLNLKLVGLQNIIIEKTPPVD